MSRIANSPGILTIPVTDPVSGVTSTTSGDATFNVPGALLSLALTPVAPALDVGEAKSLVATGTFEGGVTRNITQQRTRRATATSRRPTWRAIAAASRA
jgi:hypothetical protein